jgi:predicted CXXCH cytochrome family protein
MARRLALSLALLLGVAAGCRHGPAAGAPAAASGARAEARAAPAPAVARPRGIPTFTPLTDLELAHASTPHAYRGQPVCQQCHESGVAGVKGGDPVALCARCHDPGNMKHPYGVPQAPAPAALPLDAEGRIVCHTCHDPHDVRAHPRGLRMAYRPLCLQCHVQHGKR